MEGTAKLKLLLHLLFTAAVILPGSTFEESQLKTLYFLTIQSYPDPTATLQPAYQDGPELIAGAELAIQLINNRTDILEDYRLELINDDGGCNIVVKTVTSFVRQIFQQVKQPIVGVIGGGCSDSSLTLSPLLARDEISLINMHLGGSPLLENRILYPNAFGAAGTSHVEANAIFTLMNLNGWQRIAVLYDESVLGMLGVFSNLKRDIKTAVPGGDITFSSAVYTAEFALPALSDSFTRVIVIAATTELARRIMCVAYYEQMRFPAYQWILLVEFNSIDTDFHYAGRRYVCSAELMSRVVLQGNLMIIFRQSAFDHNSTTAAGVSYDQYSRMYKDLIDQYNRDESYPYRNLSTSSIAAVVFDEVWAMALALNNSNVDLSNYRYGQKEMTSVIRNEVYKLDFEGVSGLINFDNATGFSTRGSDIFQIVAAQQEHIASHNGRNNIVNTGSGEFITDRFQTSVATVSAPAVGAFTLLTLTLLGLIVVTHVTTLKYRKHREIKATSPILNQLIYIGCYVFILGSLLYYLYEGIPLSDEKAGYVCHAVWVWIIPIGYVLIIGTIIARTWRLYRIFLYAINPGCLISTPRLFMLVFALLSVYVIIGFLWTVIDPLKMEVISQSVVAKEIGYVKVTERMCRGSQHFYVWIGIAFTYITCLMVAMVALSLLTLKIVCKSFTTKALRVLAYLLGLVFVVCIPINGISFWDDVDIHIPYVTLSILLNSVIILCFALVFLPPILGLLKERFQLLKKLFDHIDKS